MSAPVTTRLNSPKALDECSPEQLDDALVTLTWAILYLPKLERAELRLAETTAACEQAMRDVRANVGGDEEFQRFRQAIAAEEAAQTVLDAITVRTREDVRALLAPFVTTTDRGGTR